VLLGVSFITGVGGVVKLPSGTMLVDHGADALHMGVGMHTYVDMHVMEVLLLLI
jgi:hypothetical protein